MYGIQNAFAGRTITVRGPHAARVPVFGPRCSNQHKRFTMIVSIYEDKSCILW